MILIVEIPNEETKEIPWSRTTQSEYGFDAEDIIQMQTAVLWRGETAYSLEEE